MINFITFTGNLLQKSHIYVLQRRNNKITKNTRIVFFSEAIDRRLVEYFTDYKLNTVSLLIRIKTFEK